MRFSRAILDRFRRRKPEGAPLTTTPRVYPFCTKCGHIGKKFHTGIPELGLPSEWFPEAFPVRYCRGPCVGDLQHPRHDDEGLVVRCPKCGHEVLVPCDDAEVRG